MNLINYNTMNKIIKVCSLLFLAQFFGCSENQDTPLVDDTVLSELQESKSKSKINSVSFSDIESLLSDLNDSQGNNLFEDEKENTGQNEKNTNRKAIFDKDEIISTVDSTQTTSYSFHFIYEDTPESEFYNLVFTVLPDGTRTEPFILKFVSDPDFFEEYKASDFDYGKFTGTIGLYKFSDFFADYNIFGKSECAGQFDQYNDPCSVTPITNGSGGGGSATGGGTGGNKTSGCQTWSYWQHCGGTNTNQAHSAQSCGGPGRNGAGWVTTIDCGGAEPSNPKDGNVKKDVDCTNCNASATSGLNASSRAKALVGRLRYKLRLTNRERDYLLANPRLTETVNRMLESTGYNYYTKKYIKKVIGQSMSPGVITASPFIKYPKAKALQYKKDYPELTKYLINELPKIAKNERIIKELHELTDAPKDTIREALQWGSGPEIRIEQLTGEGRDERYGSYRGHIFPELRNVLFLDVDLAKDIENLERSSDFRSEIGFLIAVTILHEYAHLGDTVFGEEFWSDLFIKDRSLENEVGIVFEKAIFGEAVWRSNAGIILRNFKK